MTTREKLYKVTYKGTRASHKFSTKKKALSQARYALRAGNTRSCIFVQKHDGSWIKVRCMTKRKR